MKQGLHLIIFGLAMTVCLGASALYSQGHEREASTDKAQTVKASVSGEIDYDGLWSNLETDADSSEDKGFAGDAPIPSKVPGPDLTPDAVIGQNKDFRAEQSISQDRESSSGDHDSKSLPQQEHTSTCSKDP